MTALSRIETPDGRIDALIVRFRAGDRKQRAYLPLFVPRRPAGGGSPPPQWIQAEETPSYWEALFSLPDRHSPALWMEWMGPTERSPAGPVATLGSGDTTNVIASRGRLVLKSYRTLAEDNPEAEILRALAKEGFPHTARPAGLLWYDNTVVGTLTHRVEGVPGAPFILIDPVADDRAGIDHAARLGAVIADMHRCLFHGLPSWVAPVTEGMIDGWIDEILFRMEAVRSFLGNACGSGLKGELAERLSSPDWPSRLKALGRAHLGSLAMATHQDLHLGQILFDVKGEDPSGNDGGSDPAARRRRHGRFYILDFEGEPARIGGRKVPLPPLRDIATIQRSLGYIKHFGFVERTGRTPEEGAEALLGDEGEAKAWNLAEAAQSAALLRSYASAAPPSLPPSASGILDVLAFWRIEKALYEVMYEQSHRASYCSIPLEGLTRELRALPGV